MSNELAEKYTLRELADLFSCEYEGNENHEVFGFESLEFATLNDVSYLANSKYLNFLKKTQAGIICITPSTDRVSEKNYLISNSPSQLFDCIARLFLHHKTASSGFTGIHPTAVIHPSCKLGNEVHIGPYVVIEQGCIIGDRTEIKSHASIGHGTTIGNDCVIHAHVVIRERTQISDRVIIQPSAIIGACGFGYTTDKKGYHTKVDQIGNVILENDVEIGALTAIDRARLKSTIISKNSKIDNLVQIAHNVHIGPGNLIVSQVGISGSTKTGKNVVLAGQVGVADHVSIGDNIIVAGGSAVTKSLESNKKYHGRPAKPVLEHHKEVIFLKNFESYIKRIENLENSFKEANLNIYIS
ncbi:MAG: UDP-3-O-(3-hydroxymyristoyl)glucosamine N-acyltransferase [Chlamydiae bacterium]|nr:UDP-3-O-(3-hydroxymyristoyl)glucosamine N-acyltransferase [Chlamydiota bacterium]